MTEQQQHLKTALEQQQAIIQDIQNLNNTLMSKRELLAKLQGVVEYLTGTGVTLPEEEVKEEIKEEPSEEV